MSRASHLAHNQKHSHMQNTNEKHENMFDMLSADDIVLKTMVRANPGVILMHQGIVIDKWNLKSLPDAEELIKRWPGLDTSTQTE